MFIRFCYNSHVPISFPHSHSLVPIPFPTHSRLPLGFHNSPFSIIPLFSFPSPLDSNSPVPIPLSLSGSPIPMFPLPLGFSHSPIPSHSRFLSFPFPCSLSFPSSPPSLPRLLVLVMLGLEKKKRARVDFQHIN